MNYDDAKTRQKNQQLSEFSKFSSFLAEAVKRISWIWEMVLFGLQWSLSVIEKDLSRYLIENVGRKLV